MGRTWSITNTIKILQGFHSDKIIALFFQNKSEFDEELASIYVLELINGDRLGAYREQIMP